MKYFPVIQICNLEVKHLAQIFYHNFTVFYL